MPNEALSYAAGLIDGEGCIGVYLNKHYNHYQLRLQIEMCDRKALDYVNSITEGKFYYKEKKSPRRSTWTWMIFNSKAEEFLQKVKPFLHTKREQADEILKANWHSYNSNNPLPDSERQIREQVSIKMKELNSRGR